MRRLRPYTRRLLHVAFTTIAFVISVLVAFIGLAVAVRVWQDSRPTYTVESISVSGPVRVAETLTLDETSLMRAGCIANVARTLVYEIPDPDHPNAKKLQTALVSNAPIVNGAIILAALRNQAVDPTNAPERISSLVNIPLPSSVVPGRGWLIIQYDVSSCGIFRGVFPVRTRYAVTPVFSILPAAAN